MSKVFDSFATENGGIRTVVISSRGYYYAVDTADTFDAGPETMVFRWNRVAKEITNHKELYSRWYATMEEARKGHEEIVKNIDDILYE